MRKKLLTTSRFSFIIIFNTGKEVIQNFYEF
jgi:hypothetical protein